MKRSLSESMEMIEGHLRSALSEADKAQLSMVAVRISEALDCLTLNAATISPTVDDKDD